MKFYKLLSRFHFNYIRNRPPNYNLLTTRSLSAVQSHIIKSRRDEITFPNASATEMIWNALEKWPDKTAVECGITGKSYTYIEIKRFSRRFAVSLLKSGLRPGNVVTAILPNIPEYVPVVLGTIDAGLIFTGINPVYTADEILFQIKDTNSDLVVVHPDLLPQLLKAKEKLGRDLKILCTDRDNNASLPLPNGINRFTDFVGERFVDVTDGELSRLKGVTTNMESLVLLPYSSGTTGLPKGVCITHKNLTANLCQSSHSSIEIVQAAVGNYQDTVPLVLPIFHAYGCICVMLKSMLSGAKLVTLPKFDPQVFLRVLTTNENLKLYVVPPIIIYLATHPSVTQRHLERIDVTMTGGAPCSGMDIQRYIEKKPHFVLQGYGMTEASPLLTMSTIDSTKYSSIGKVISNTEVKVVDTKSGDTLPAHQQGELCFRGPQVMKGYLNRPKETAETIDSEGWLHTGDIGYFDDDEDFYVADRIKELIKVKGYQVAPAELEALLRNHPDVYDAAVTAIPNSRTGEAPIAFVIPKATAPSINEETLKQYAADKVAPYKRISKIVLVDTIPKSATGKILRKKLKEVALQYAE